MYLEGRKRHVERFPPSADLLLNYSQQLGLGQVEAKRQESLVGLPHGWQEPSYISHHLLLSRCAFGGCWNWNPGCGCLNSYIKQCLNLAPARFLVKLDSGYFS